MIRRNINYLDVADCMYISEHRSNVYVLSRLLSDTFNEIQCEFSNMLKNKGIYIYKKDPNSENSDIYVTCGNLTTVYKPTIKNILKIADLVEYTRAMIDVKKVLNSDDHDAEIRRVLKERKMVKLPYIDTVYVLNEAGSIDNLKDKIVENLIRLFNRLGFHTVSYSDEIITVIMNDNHTLHFRKNFKDLSFFSRVFKRMQL